MNDRVENPKMRVKCFRLEQKSETHHHYSLQQKLQDRICLQKNIKRFELFLEFSVILELEK